jgi:hypothetical protein
VSPPGLIIAVFRSFQVFLDMGSDQWPGVARDGGVGQLSDEVIGAVVAAVRPARPAGHGSAWQQLQAEQQQITAWVSQGLSVVKIGTLLGRRGVVVPYRTLHRFCVQCCGFGKRGNGAGGRRRAERRDNMQTSTYGLLARGMGLRHKPVQHPGPIPRLRHDLRAAVPHIVDHRRVRDLRAVLVDQPLEDPPTRTRVGPWRC